MMLMDRADITYIYFTVFPISTVVTRYHVTIGIYRHFERNPKQPFTFLGLHFVSCLAQQERFWARAALRCETRYQRRVNACEYDVRPKEKVIFPLRIFAILRAMSERHSRNQRLPFFLYLFFLVGRYSHIAFGSMVASALNIVTWRYVLRM